jgi:hypothetical protein
MIQAEIEGLPGKCSMLLDVKGFREAMEQHRNQPAQLR